MTLTLIIATFNQPEALDKTLRGVSMQTRLPNEVFIADDGSDERTRQVIDRWKSQLTIPLHHLWHEHNGFRKVILLNQAVATTTSDYLIFTDGDCVPDLHYFEDHERLAEQGYWVQGRRCMVKQAYVKQFIPGTVRLWSWILRGRLSNWAKAIRLPRPIILRNTQQRGIIGCNMAFWRSDVVAVNGFDENCKGRGIGPDSDLGTRIYNLGRKRKFVYGQAIVYHLDHPILPRENMAMKRQHLDEIIRSGRTRCECGLDRHLTPTP